MVVRFNRTTSVDWTHDSNWQTRILDTVLLQPPNVTSCLASSRDGGQFSSAGPDSAQEAEMELDTDQHLIRGRSGQ